MPQAVCKFSGCLLGKVCHWCSQKSISTSASYCLSKLLPRTTPQGGSHRSVSLGLASFLLCSLTYSVGWFEKFFQVPSLSTCPLYPWGPSGGKPSSALAPAPLCLSPIGAGVRKWGTLERKLGTPAEGWTLPVSLTYPSSLLIKLHAYVQPSEFLASLTWLFVYNLKELKKLFTNTNRYKYYYQSLLNSCWVQTSFWLPDSFWIFICIVMHSWITIHILLYP